MATATPKPTPKPTAKPTPKATTQAKPPSDAQSRRGPRRTPVVTAAQKAKGPDLEALRAALYAAILEEHPGADLEPVGRAFDVAVAAHDGQTRVTGEPFVTHPIASAQILAELGIEIPQKTRAGSTYVKLAPPAKGR